jgi:hypothetical protein
MLNLTELNTDSSHLIIFLSRKSDLILALFFTNIQNLFIKNTLVALLSSAVCRLSRCKLVSGRSACIWLLIATPASEDYLFKISASGGILTKTDVLVCGIAQKIHPMPQK